MMKIDKEVYMFIGFTLLLLVASFQIRSCKADNPEPKIPYHDIIQ